MKNLLFIITAILCAGFSPVNDYPIDGFESTGIRRLDYLDKLYKGEIEGRKRLPDGALKPLDYVKLNLVDRRDEILGIPEKDPEFQQKVAGLFRGLNRNYSVTVLDITPGRPIRYAGHRESAGYQPGSVGKIVVMTAFFEQLCEIYPNDFDERRELMKSKMVKAGNWAMGDHHTVPIYDPETQAYSRRTIQAADVFSLYEWVDHMVSPSNNGAASVVWREAVLMHVFKEKYPELTFEEAEEYFKNTPKTELSEMANTMVNKPLRDIGITHDEWRLGSFFTRSAGRYIPARGGSIGSPIGLMKFMIALERGQIIDEESSLEMKRLLYMTGRRIRYAASKSLSDAAVYFKSGSLYKCQQEEGFECGKYMGNAYNYMNSVAMVEQADGSKYMVCLMTNVKKKNSAYDHLMLASRIDALIRN
ncbi:MAG: serine hydrolase [Flavobacteriaceae bacterium]